MHATDESIPILDLGPYLAGEPGADGRLAAELRRACEEVGFYFITDHGVPQSLIDAAFAETARFHAQPLADKMALLINDHMIGYLPLGYSTFRSSTVNRNTKHDLNEALFIRRERAPDDPDVVSGRRWRGLNRWPPALPGFRDTMLRYFRTMEALGQKLLPIYALALDLPRGYFLPLFDGAHINLRLSHYPANAAAEDNQFGIAPHADAGFLTMLPQSAVPGLEIRTASGRWLAAPPLPGSYLVNTGDTLNRWTNGRFLSTPHRASNNSGEERYAMPFFYDPNTDTMIECLPTCQAPGNPPKYPPQTSAIFMPGSSPGTTPTSRTRRSRPTRRTMLNVWQGRAPTPTLPRKQGREFTEAFANDPPSLAGEGGTRAAGVGGWGLRQLGRRGNLRQHG